MARTLFLILTLAGQYLLMLPMQDSEAERRERERLLRQYLLMLPIQDSLKKGDFSGLEAICQKRISVNLETPFSMQGYFPREQFNRDFSGRFSLFIAVSIEWSSMQVEENLAVQSLNLILMDRSSRKKIVYKLIFFMVKEKEWKLYYLRGLRL